MKEKAYKAAGVNVEAGAMLVERIKPLAKGTSRKGVMSSIGGFGARFDLKAEGFKDPILISGTDGVGTKIRVAIDAGKHDTVGIDLVAMCVNDIIVQGAEPLYFLDYYASSALDVDAAESVIKGIAAGCVQAGCALTGGETAEMPGMVAGGDYDLAGFVVGAVERADEITGDEVKEGDVVLGLASSGLHSNGFSLVRKIVKEQGLSYRDKAPFDSSQSLGDALLMPTRIYVRSLLQVLREAPSLIKGMAHITGGGLIENAARMVPESLAINFNAESWTLPPVFCWLAAAGKLTVDDLAVTFNCGIGMIVICAPAQAEKLQGALQKTGESVFQIGAVVKRQGGGPRVHIENMSQAWNREP